MSVIKIFLDNYDNACYPGQTLAGRIECNFNKEKNLRAIRIKFRGRAETEWHETERHYDHHRKEHRSRSVRYCAEETYFEAEYILVQGGDNFQLPAGTHTYPFSYILPAQLPSSFEGSYGNIRYYIKATVDRPWKFDHEDRFGLNVVSPLDLNYLPGLRDPVAISVDKTMCSCWCNDSGALTFNISLPASGFVPGQEVNIGAYIQNMTNVNAENVKFKIVGNMEFIAHYPHSKARWDEIAIGSCMEGGVGAHGEKSWTSSLTIPLEHHPNLIPCSIINITYSLRAKVVVPCPHTDLESEVPLMIGSIPLTGINTTFPAGPPPEIPTFPLPEGAPLLPNVPAPYPGETAPYPPGGNAPYPPGGNSPYPPGGSGPYPPGGSAPYPPGGSAPYPPGGSAPYPPATNAPAYPNEKVPYPPDGNSAYPSGGSAPYPPAGAPNGFGDAKSPSAPTGGPPYPSGGGAAPYPPTGGLNASTSAPSAPASAPTGSAPYPSGGSPYPPNSSAAPYPPTSAPYTAPAADSGFELPSYDEAKQLKEKSGKPE